ncbi:DUF5987 family protein [Streptomyces griseocarneus]|nr:DUF5987 family protein [Streptomyces griseocarneus]MBZ6477623.1 DUF5987 family protein [Streptomyces griseocarneus]
MPDDQYTARTLEAYADTIVDGAAAAGALELLRWDATGISRDLDELARLLNEHARSYAGEHALPSDGASPAFEALAPGDRAALVRRLTGPGHPEREFWVLLALFCNMAFDSAAHLHTADAIAAGHPGLTAMGMRRPDPDGLWRYPDHSYGRPLARLHPDTTPSGSPA